MNSRDNAKKAAVPLSNYQFDFGLDLNLSGKNQGPKSLKDQKQPYSSPSVSRSQNPSPNQSWNKGSSWTHKPVSSNSPAYGSNNIPSSNSSSSMSGDIFGKSWVQNSSSQKKNNDIGIIGGVNGAAAPHLFGDLFGEALAKQKNNTPVTSQLQKNSGSSIPRSTGVALRDQKPIPSKGQDPFDVFTSFGNSGGVNSQKNGIGSKKSESKGGDPFTDFGKFSSPSSNSKVAPSSGKFSSSSTNAKVAPSGGDPFSAFGNFSSPSSTAKAAPSSGNAFGDLGEFSSAPTKTKSAPRSSDAFGEFSSSNTKTEAFGDFQNGETKASSAEDLFAPSLNVPVSNNGLDFLGVGSDPYDALGSSFASQKQNPPTASGSSDFMGGSDPYEALGRSFGTSQKPKSSDPLDNLFKPSSAQSNPISVSDDWGFDGDLGDDSGTTTELEGLPPPPAGVSIGAAKNKGMENYKQGQYADAIKWLTWAVALIEKASDGSGAFGEVLACRASCYKEVGEYKKAIADCTQVLEKDQSNATVLLQRALLYESTEKYKLGVEDLRSVLKIDPVNRVAKSTLSRLSKMA